jgi:hypothetical protein
MRTLVYTYKLPSNVIIQYVFLGNVPLKKERESLIEKFHKNTKTNYVQVGYAGFTVEYKPAGKRRSKTLPPALD